MGGGRWDSFLSSLYHQLPAGPGGSRGALGVGRGCSEVAHVDMDQNKEAPMAERRVSSLGTWAGFDLEVTPCVDPQGWEGRGLGA